MTKRPEFIYHGNALKEIVTEYLESGSCKCPRCGSDDLYRPGPSDFLVYPGYEAVTCNDCDFEWENLYEIKRIGIKTPNHEIYPDRVVNLTRPVSETPYLWAYMMEGVWVTEW